MAMTSSSKPASEPAHEFAGLTRANPGENGHGRHAREWLGYLWLVPGVAMLIALFLFPLASMVRDSFTDPAPGWGNYIALIRDPVYKKVIFNSLWSAAVATIGCLLIGYPTAYAIFRAAARWRAICLGLVLFSFAVGTVPRSFSWLVILGDHGLISQIYTLVTGKPMAFALLYNQIGVAVGMIHVMLPYMIMLLIGSMARVNQRLVPAARTLGANRLQAFAIIFVPLTLQGVLAGTMLVFIYSLGFFLVPAVLGGAEQTTVVMLIQSLTMQSGIWGMGAGLSVLVIVVSVAGAAAYVRMTGLGNFAERD